MLQSVYNKLASPLQLIARDEFRVPTCQRWEFNSWKKDLLIWSPCPKDFLKCFSIWWIISPANACVDNLNRLHCWPVRCITLSRRMAIIGLSCGQPPRHHNPPSIITFVNWVLLIPRLCWLCWRGADICPWISNADCCCSHLVILVKKWRVHPSGFQTSTRFCHRLQNESCTDRSRVK